MKFNGAQLHLLLNHLPVIIPLIGSPLVALGWRTRSLEMRKIGAALLTIAALIAIPAYLTGDWAEDVVKNYPNVSRLLIQDHENSALYSLVLVELSGALSLLLLIGLRLSKAWATRAAGWAVVLLLSVISIGAISWTAHLGGLIQHEEIRSTDRF